MKTHILFLLGCCLLLAGPGIAQNIWTQKNNMSGPARMGAVAFSINSKGYLGTGSNWGVNYYDDFWEYDHVNDNWTQKANFTGGARYRSQGFSVGSKGYIGTGTSATATNDFWEYDPITNAWTTVASMSGMARFGATGFVIGSKIYSGTGVDVNYTKDFWEYDTGLNAWTQKADFGGAEKIYAVGFAINGKGYLGTGVDINMNPFGSNDLWEYDPTANTWIQKASLPGAGRSEAVAFALGSYGYIGTGTSNWGSTALDDFWRYDPATNSWLQVAVFPGGVREHATAFTIGCKAYVGTGFINDDASTLNNDLWEYTPDGGCSTGINFSASDTGLCQSECVSFTDLSDNSPIAWQWYFPGSLTPASNDQHPINICYPNTGLYSVTLIACNASDCDTLILADYIQVDSIVNPSLGADTLLCNGDILLLDAGAGFTSYQWSNGSTLQNISVSTAGTYWVIAATGGCESGDSVIVSYQSCAAANAMFSVSDTSFCDKKCLDFTDLSTNNPTSWYWSFPGAVPPSDTVQHPVNICYNSFGSFDVTLVACNGSGCDTLHIDDFINEFSVPAVPVVTSNADTLFSTPAFSYQWYFNSLPIPGATDSFYVYPQPGSYYVIVSDSNGCASSSVIIYTGLDEHSGGISATIYTDPSTGSLVINCNGLTTFAEAGVYDRAGRLVYNGTCSNGRNITGMLLTDGIYFLRLQHTSKSWHRKFILVR